MKGTTIMGRNPINLLALGSAVLALAACDVRRGGEGEDVPVAEEPTPDPSPTLTPEAEDTQGVSILRDDLEGVEPIEAPTRPVELTIPFPDSSDLSERAERLLVSAVESDALDEDWPVILRGHTDSSGNDEANLRASRARAETVAAWLVERGVADDRIEIIAFGEQNPAQPNANPDGSPNEAGRRANRRVEISIAPPPVEEEREPTLIDKRGGAATKAAGKKGA